jgi:hypothetical protein
MRIWARDVEALAPNLDEAEPGSFEHRALLALRGLGALYVAGMVLAVFVEPNSTSLLLTLVFNGAAAMLVAVYLLIARGLRHLEGWSIAAARPVLAFVVVEDLSLVVASAVNGHIRLPIASVMAIWALLGPADVRPTPRAGRFAGLVILLAAAMLSVLGLSQPIFGWGGVLDVQQEQLVSKLVVSCAPAEGAAGPSTPPPSIQVDYDWWWTKHTPVPSGLDIVVIGWSGTDAQGRPLYLLGPLGPASEGVYQGRRTDPSLEMANAIASTTKGSWQWGIELGEQQLRPGHIALELGQAREDLRGASSLVVTASYVHLGLWHAEAVPVTCGF